MNLHRFNRDPIPKPLPKPKKVRKWMRRQRKRGPRLDRDRFADLPIPKVVRIIDKTALAQCRLKPCAFCGKRPGKGVVVQPHHVRTVGAGGGDDQVVPLCSGWASSWCHHRTHTGEISREQLAEKFRNRKA